ncbi:heme-binding protein [Acinetobacter baumannii]|uniref:heme-binding protein n=1 Tax=Acinetobacter baumannii TaxID=470 RepID=UPI002341D757|nr:heme-binding protein [Acinetobacter baumannii]MDC5047867.1 heme-binding protein [Acinetobacter baumannii]MDH2622505.1 heme-binding protein [Acinetobacter baumannii]
MENIYQSIISYTSSLIFGKCNGCCVSLLDQNGTQILFFKLGNPTPCSSTFSTQKAFTAYSFSLNNDDVYKSLVEIGSQNLINNKFCFIPGGVVTTDKNQTPYFLGVSTEVPTLDKTLALEISNLIKEEM